jgi:hypothetical protein
LSYLSGKVYAFSHCSSTPCSGSYWTNWYLECPPFNCDGSYNQGQTDPDGKKCKGIRYSGYTTCDLDVAGCPCNSNVCNSCL